jgi:hypothetical protein
MRVRTGTARRHPFKEALVNRPRVTIASLAIVLSVLAACDEPARVVTMPSDAPNRSVSTGGPCDGVILTRLQNGISTYIVGRANQTTASRLLGDVRQACSGKVPAPNPQLAVAYADQLVSWWKLNPATSVVWKNNDPTTFWAYMTDLFNYVGRNIDNRADGPTAVLSDQGFIGVCKASEDCEVIAKAKTSGIKIFPLALSATGTDRFLVTGGPVRCTGDATKDEGLDGFTDLQVWGQCIDISIDPKTGSENKPQGSAATPLSFTFRDVPGPALVQTCLANSAHAAAQLYLKGVGTQLPDGAGRLRLAQRSLGTNSVRVRARPRTPDQEGVRDFSNGFIRDFTCEDAIQVAAADLPPGSAQHYAARLLRRAASRVAQLVSPRPLYAGHAGLGGFGFVSEASLFGPADPFVFQGSFDNPHAGTARVSDAPGQQPSDDDTGRAKWTIATQPPGYVLVRSTPFSGFLAPSDGGTNNVVEINQAGGAAEEKLGMTMLANLAYFDGDKPAATGDVVRASVGWYRIRWSSLISSPRAGGTEGAPFLALGRAADGSPVTLARFAYTNGASSQSGPVLFDRKPTGLTWTQGAPRRFEILVDLTGGKSYLRTVNADGTSSPIAGAVQEFAIGTRLTQAGWVMDRRDNQVIVMDNLEIARLPDDYKPSEQ